MAAFTRAIEVEPGDVLNSRHQRSLALAVNDRLRFSADFLWRWAWAWYNSARLVRNPEGQLFPAEGELWKLYSHFLGRSGWTWPVTGPGEPAGANVASVIPQLVFGNAGLANEPDRLVPFPLTLPGGIAPETAADFWQLGALQRGGRTADGALENTPAFEAAQTIFRFAFPPITWHNKSYGGRLPIPPTNDAVPWCGDTGTPYELWPNLTPYWTSLAIGESTTGLHGTVTTLPDGRKRVTYAGSCPCGSTNTTTGHVLGTSDAPFAWYVYVSKGVILPDGSCEWWVDRFDKARWVEGPYLEAGGLSHTDFPGILRTAWNFAAGFRGTEGQRTGNFDIRAVAIDNQALWTRPYPLAPAFAVPDGGGGILAVYPHATLIADPGTAETFLQGDSGTWAPHTGFHIVAFHAGATGLLAPVRIQFRSGESQHDLFLSPDADGIASGSVWLAAGMVPPSIRVAVIGGLSLAGGGSVTCQAAELAEYKPQPWDEYLVARIASSDSDGDPFGPEYTGSAAIVAGLHARGCLVGFGPAPQADWITDNPVYEAFRTASRRLRFIGREQLNSYTLDGPMYELRFTRALTGIPLAEADPWEGIAPPADPVPSGALEAGALYVVGGTTGSVEYAGTAYAIGEEVLASSGPDYASLGDAALYVREGIVPEAPEAGWSNEWVMILQTHVYNETDSSIWKPPVYADWFTFGTPAHFSSPSSGPLRDFINASNSFAVDPDTGDAELYPPSVQFEFINPEAPSAYTYSLNANAAASDAFKTSRQIHELPYEIESCQIEWSGGAQIVVVRLNRRLRAHPNAPASVPADPDTWTADVLARLDGTHATAPEDWRTDDNAVREYIRKISGDGHECDLKTGDTGWGGTPSQACFGSCFPGFIFGKLIPLCREDGNDVIEATDTRPLADVIDHVEDVIGTICEAFVAGATSIDRTCAGGAEAVGLYEYTREALWFEAFGDRSVSPFPLATRPDRPMGFGPLVNQWIYADTVNRLARAVNLLTRIRIDLPIQWELRQTIGTGQAAVTPATGGFGSCDSSTYQVWADDLNPPTAVMPAPDPLGWVVYTTAPTFSVVHGASLECCGGTSDWCLLTSRIDYDWQATVLPAWAPALPAHIAAWLASATIGTVARVARTRYHHIRRDEDPRDLCLGLAEPWRYEKVIEIDETICVLVEAGTPFTLPAPSRGDHAKRKPLAGDPTFCVWDSMDLAAVEILGWGQLYAKVALVDLP